MNETRTTEYLEYLNLYWCIVYPSGSSYAVYGNGVDVVIGIKRSTLPIGSLRRR